MDGPLAVRSKQPRTGTTADARTKLHASGKLKNRSFRIMRIEYDVFFNADSESPHMT